MRHRLASRITGALAGAVIAAALLATPASASVKWTGVGHVAAHATLPAGWDPPYQNGVQAHGYIAAANLAGFGVYSISSAYYYRVTTFNALTGATLGAYGCNQASGCELRYGYNQATTPCYDIITGVAIYIWTGSNTAGQWVRSPTNLWVNVC